MSTQHFTSCVASAVQSRWKTFIFAPLLALLCMFLFQLGSGSYKEMFQPLLSVRIAFFLPSLGMLFVCLAIMIKRAGIDFKLLREFGWYVLDCGLVVNLLMFTVYAYQAIAIAGISNIWGFLTFVSGVLAAILYNLFGNATEYCLEAIESKLSVQILMLYVSTTALIVVLFVS